MVTSLQASNNRGRKLRDVAPTLFGFAMILGAFIIKYDLYEADHVVHVESVNLKKHVTHPPSFEFNNMTTPLISNEIIQEDQEDNNNTKTASSPSSHVPIIITANNDIVNQSSLSSSTMQNDDDNDRATIVWTEDFVNSALQQQGGLSQWNGISVAVGLDEQFNSTIHGTIQDGRLVVNLNHTFAFWAYGNVKLCKVLRNMTLVAKLGEESLEQRQQTYFRNHSAIPLPLVNMTFNCTLLMQDQGMGQGNWITALYAVRMATELARVDFQFQCDPDAYEKANYMLPWFAGSYPYTPATDNKIWPHIGPLPTEAEACPPKYAQLRIDLILDLIQNDIRKMAVTVAGSSAEYQHPEVPIDQKPLIPNVQLDDVAIHFRCGDVFGGAKRNDFGMIAFSAYRSHILNPHTIKRVGIVTQPFEPDRNRPQDSRKSKECKTLVYLLIYYLKGFLREDTIISIHNGPNETLPLAFARLAMAKQSFTSLSSFGIFPVLASFGQGYFQKGNRGVNPFNTHISKYAGYENLHMMEAPFMSTWTIFKTPINETYWWFTHA